jgi:8-oxo-dGTP pyrophosphatase MutT (NUDIX family)
MSEEKTKWKKEVAAGGIVYQHRDGQTFILMVNPRGPNYGPARDYWTWPKGIQDKEDESLEQLAVREVREEGGVNAKPIVELGYVKFFRNSVHFGPALKFVHFWLMEYIDGDPSDHDKEMANAEWVVIDEVEGRLKFPHDKEIFARARKALNQQSNA